VSEKIVKLNKKFFFSFLIIFVCFLLDRCTKVLVINKFIYNDFKELYINSYLNLTLLWNKGIAFGLFQSEAIFYHLISIIIFTIILFIIYLAYKSRTYFELIGLSLVIGGAIGNLIDRIYYNAVPDFIDFHIGNFHWFTFNVSDICITIGLVQLIFYDICKNIKFKNNV